jgi:hypothetical protein
MKNLYILIYSLRKKGEESEKETRFYFDNDFGALRFVGHGGRGRDERCVRQCLSVRVDEWGSYDQNYGRNVSVPLEVWNESATTIVIKFDWSDMAEFRSGGSCWFNCEYHQLSVDSYLAHQCRSGRNGTAMVPGSVYGVNPYSSVKD